MTRVIQLKEQTDEALATEHKLGNPGISEERDEKPSELSSTPRSLSDSTTMPIGAKALR